MMRVKIGVIDCRENNLSLSDINKATLFLDIEL